MINKHWFRGFIPRAFPKGIPQRVSTLIQEMDWCRQVISHYLDQCCPHIYVESPRIHRVHVTVLAFTGTIIPVLSHLVKSLHLLWSPDTSMFHLGAQICNRAFAWIYDAQCIAILIQKRLIAFLLATHVLGRRTGTAQQWENNSKRSRKTRVIHSNWFVKDHKLITH